MHLKNWALIYPEGRKPQLAPAYDFVSTIQYSDDRRMALSIAGEKDTKKIRCRLTCSLRLNHVVEVTIQAAEKFVTAWRRMKNDLPLDDEARNKIDEQLASVPLTSRFLQGNPVPVAATGNPAHNRRGRPPKTPPFEHDIE
jgi:serine/threonine-protein kinase HipA